MMSAAWPSGDEILRATPCRWSVAVADADGALLWGRDPDAPQKAASTIKLAVLIALFRAIDAGALGLADRRTLRDADKVAGSGVLKALGDGLDLSLHDLAHLMIAISDNTASNLLIDAVGPPAVNAALDDLGATRSVLGRRFYGRAALPGEAENLTTARDLARLLAAIANDRAASPASCAAMRDYLRGQAHLDRLARRLSAGIAYAGKGGTLPGTALDAGIIFAPARPLIVAAIATDLPDPFAGDDAMGALALAAVREWGSELIVDR